CGALRPVCGATEMNRISRISALDGYVTYFEMIVETPVASRIGVALSREPSMKRGTPIVPAALQSVELTLTVEAAHGSLPASAVAQLRAGDVVMFDSRLGEAASVRLGETIVARGQGG